MFKSKYLKSFTVGVILASSIFMGSSALAAKNFTDLNADPAHTLGVTYLNSLDVFDYKEGNKLNGRSEVSRAEVAKVLHNLYGNDIPPERQYTNNLKDINSKTKFYEDIVWAYESNIFDGDNKGNFNPAQTLTRAQMAKVLVNTFLLDTNSTSKFKDVSKNHWAYEYINILGAEGISVGSNGNFMPEQKVTLNQFSTFVERIISKYSPEQQTQVIAPVGQGGNPFLAPQEEEKLELKTMDEVLALGVAMYESSEFKPESIKVLTKEDVYKTLRRFTGSDLDLSQYLNGYNTYGRLLIISSVPTEGGYKTTISIGNQWTEEQQQEYKAKIANSAEYIRDNYDLSSDYKTIKAISDFISSRLTYGELVAKDDKYLGWYGGGMCETYANATASLLTAFGYKNVLVDGQINLGHRWNAVELDGNWYHIDNTIYDSFNQNERFLLMTQSQLENDPDVSYKIDTDFKASNVPYNKQ